MPIPEFFHFFRPCLEMLADGQPHYWRDIESRLIERFHLTPEEQAELIPSGRKTRVADRVQWALTYLRQAGLAESTERGWNKITPRGSEYLRRAPALITPDDLMEFDEFAAFAARSRERRASPAVPLAASGSPVAVVRTPQEAIAAAYDEHNTALAQDALQRVKAMTPARFEKLIVDLMLGLGYGGTSGSGRTLGRTGDEGVDGVINQDKLGLEKIYLQAKRWDTRTVGRVELQAFVGALNGQGATKGVFITSSTFSQEARDYAARTMNFKISLIDGLELARLMIENDLGVALEQRYDVKRIDSDFFLEE